MKANAARNLTLALAICFIAAYFVVLQFLSPVLYDIDGYYHVAVSRFLKDYGPRYDFHWAQFSTFKHSFSDSDFLFHLLYFLCLRSVTLANISMVLCIYFLIQKRWVNVFVMTLLHSLTHLSFFTVLIFAIICEITRYFTKKEFFRFNFYAVILGSVMGCFLHPNYPNNLLTLYLNGLLVPLHSLGNSGIELAGELQSLPARLIFFNNFPVFLAAGFILWAAMRGKGKAGFPTLVWWWCTVIYLVGGFLATRLWYQVNVLFFIFFASFLKDWGWGNDGEEARPVRYSFIIACFAAIFAVSVGVFNNLNDTLKGRIRYGIGYEDAARWMSRNIPPGETIYHASWSDAPVFMCLNPKDDYLTMCDPIYMYQAYPRLYHLYRGLAEGRIAVSAEILRKKFKVTYGFVNKGMALYEQIKNDAAGFEILYENDTGVIFKILA